MIIDHAEAMSRAISELPQIITAARAVGADRAFQLFAKVIEKAAKDAVEEASASERILRRLLWAAHANGGGYGDDGELQFESMDFKRMPAHQLESMIAERGMKQINEYLKTPAGKAWLKSRNL